VNAGHTLPKNASEDFDLYAGQSLFAISSKSGHNVAFLLITP
jgi:hypothetical protein